MPQPVPAIGATFISTINMETPQFFIVLSHDSSMITYIHIVLKGLYYTEETLTLEQFANIYDKYGLVIMMRY